MQYYYIPILIKKIIVKIQSYHTVEFASYYNIIQTYHILKLLILN